MGDGRWEMGECGDFGLKIYPFPILALSVSRSVASPQGEVSHFPKAYSSTVSGKLGVILAKAADINPEKRGWGRLGLD